MQYEIYEQKLFCPDDETPPDAPPGEGWEPFAAYGTVEHNGLRSSLGGRLETFGVVVWRRRVDSEEK